MIFPPVCTAFICRSRLIVSPKFFRIGWISRKFGESREEAAYSAVLDLLRGDDRPTDLYVANGVMALGVMRALADLGLRCPHDVSIASTDTIAGRGGVSPRLTRTEHPVAEMTNEAVRLLVDRISGKDTSKPRTVVFAPSLVVGDSCAPPRQALDVRSFRQMLVLIPMPRLCRIPPRWEDRMRSSAKTR